MHHRQSNSRNPGNSSLHAQRPPDQFLMWVVRFRNEGGPGNPEPTWQEKWQDGTQPEREENNSNNNNSNKKMKKASCPSYIAIATACRKLPSSDIQPPLQTLLQIVGQCKDLGLIAPIARQRYPRTLPKNPCNFLDVTLHRTLPIMSHYIAICLTTLLYLSVSMISKEEMSEI